MNLTEIQNKIISEKINLRKKSDNFVYNFKKIEKYIQKEVKIIKESKNLNAENVKVTKNINTKTMLEIKRTSRFSSLSFMKLLLIKVKNVKKANEIVKINIAMINKFLFNNANII